MRGLFASSEPNPSPPKGVGLGGADVLTRADPALAAGRHALFPRD
jgi:hypothetical protein